MNNKHCGFTALLWLLLLPFLATAQTPCHPSPNLKDYNCDQIKVMKNNWRQFVQREIFDDLNYPNIDAFPIALDSYGSPYADLALFKDFKTANFETFRKGVKNFYLQKHSMFEYFEQRENQTKLAAAIKQLKNPSDQDFYQQILSDYSGGKDGKYFNYQSVEDNQYVDEFYQKWDDFHFKKLNQKLVQKIEEVKPDKILFFIHGFNVPHALAAVQSIELMDKHLRTIDPNSKTLLIPVFWPANDAKRFNKKLGDIFRKNIRQWFFYSNRAYHAGLGLRQVIVDLEDASIPLPELYVFAHSLGSTAATTLFINTTSKLQSNFQYYLKNNCGTTAPPIQMSSYTDALMKQSEYINNRLLHKFNTIRLPNTPIRVFLNAAAIPGKSTFTDMCEHKKQNTAIFSGINPNDKTLKKMLGLSRRLGVTTLGLNKDNEAIEVRKNLFENHHYFSNNTPMTHKEHNIFNYMAEAEFQKLLREFFLYEFP